MIKVGITNADIPLAGEVIRILVNHPEAEIVSLYAPNLVGRNLISVHHGFIGEPPLKFTDKLNIDDLDIIIVPEKSDVSDVILNNIEDKENLKVIGRNKEVFSLLPRDILEIGVSEINRKALVRGAAYSYLASPAITPALIALIPLANFLLLNSDININVTLPQDLSENTDIEADTAELSDQITSRQTSFNSKINLVVSPSKARRSAVTQIILQNNLPIDEIVKIYEQIYDDHNFSFISLADVDIKEVTGTQKTVIHLDKPSPDFLKIKVVSDARMRGGAGDIIHVMNLFFGLHEKTGLHFKPSAY